MASKRNLGGCSFPHNLTPEEAARRLKEGFLSESPWGFSAPIKISKEKQSVKKGIYIGFSSSISGVRVTGTIIITPPIRKAPSRVRLRIIDAEHSLDNTTFSQAIKNFQINTEKLLEV